MINAFQMNTVGIATGLRLAGNAQSDDSAGECLFSILLNKLNGGQETDMESSGASLFTREFQANMNDSGRSASLITNPNVSLNSKVSAPDQTSINPSDFLLPESAMPNLVSFLENKGFSVEQIDNIVLSSRNDEGLIQIHKLVTAIQSARTGTLSDNTGLGVEMALVPKVQELLFNMGMGVGEVRETIEKSKDETGGISLDKLTEALNEKLGEPLTRTEVISLLEQNNIRVTSHVAEIAAPATGNTQAADTAPVIPVQAKGAADHQWSHNMGGAGSAEKNDIIPNRGASAAESAASGLQREIGNESQAPQTPDINKSALELKKEFSDFVDGKTKNPGELSVLKTTAQAEGETVQAREMTATKETPGPVNTASGQAKTVARESAQEAGPLNQAFSKGQAQWQKGDQEKIIDILKGENQSNARTDAKGITGEQNEAMKDPGGFLKQGDQKTGQDILSSGNESKTVPGALKNEGADFKDSLLNIREAQSMDPSSQNMSKIPEDIAAKTQTKGVYNLPEPLPKVFDRMVIMIKNGEQTGKLMIQPPELGKIDIDLSLKNGHLQANLTTENIAVKEIIEANLNQLKQQLNNQGLVVEQFNVSVGSQNRQFREGFGQAGNSGNGSSHSGASGMEEVTAATDERTSPGLMNNGRYRIDLRV